MLGDGQFLLRNDVRKEEEGIDQRECRIKKADGEGRSEMHPRRPDISQETTAWLSLLRPPPSSDEGKHRAGHCVNQRPRHAPDMEGQPRNILSRTKYPKETFLFVSTLCLPGQEDRTERGREHPEGTCAAEKDFGSGDLLYAGRSDELLRKVWYASIVCISPSLQIRPPNLPSLQISSSEHREHRVLDSSGTFEKLLHQS